MPQRDSMEFAAAFALGALVGAAVVVALQSRARATERAAHPIRSRIRAESARALAAVGSGLADRLLERVGGKGR